MKTVILSTFLALAVSYPAFSHDAEVTRESVCQRGPGVYFLEVNKVFYRTTVVEKGGLIFIDNPPYEAAGGLCYCREQSKRPPILVCD